MTPSSTNYIANQLNFGTIKGRKVIADFTGGKITSDAGIVLLAELDKKLKITARFAECFRDYRDSSYVDPVFRRWRNRGKVFYEEFRIIYFGYPS